VFSSFFLKIFHNINRALDYLFFFVYFLWIAFVSSLFCWSSCTTTVTEIRESASFSPTPLKRKKKRKKKVRFLSPLVTKVGETHCVLPADRHKFFYSRENIMWFRQEFESEKYPLCGLCESFERSTMHLCSGFSFRFKRRTPETLAPEDVGPP